MANSQGVVMTNHANKVEGKHIHNYSTFTDTLSYRLYNTLRFGDYTPSFVMEGVERDSISVNTRDIIDSLSLKAPFKGSIRKIKESFMVPNMAILPRNWDLIYTQPSNGDDVPKDANCVIFDFSKKFSTLWLSFLAGAPSQLSNSTTPQDFAIFLTGLIRLLVLGEYVYSNGCLLNVCGAKYSRDFKCYHESLPHSSYDEYFDFIISRAFSGIRSFVVNYQNGNQSISKRFKGLSSEEMGNGSLTNSFRSFLELFRENPTAKFLPEFFIESQFWAAGEVGYMNEGLTDYMTFVQSELLGSTGTEGVLAQTPTFYYTRSIDEPFDDELKEMNPNTLNLSRILAYQLVCAHYYTNSSIDFVYSAELYRQYIRSLVSYSEPVNNPYFTINGYSHEYDILSGKRLVYALFTAISVQSENTFYKLATSIGVVPRSLSLYAAIFAFRKSLRYGDYFVGSRPRPIAPINTDVSVNNNMVSVIDITKSIQAQRFANAVMRSRSKIEEYVESLFGKRPAPDYHNPFFLSRETEVIYGDEVQNTAEGQISNPNSRTANLASNSGQFTFTFHNDDMHPCIYLQIISFDIKRAYTRTIERQFMHVDRYDMFNPDFQYIGDQPIYGTELGYLFGTSYPAVFGYQTRDEEYKQRFDQASGGFVENLPGWILTDRDASIQSVGVLDPDFIRSYNTELDQFFLSLTGYSLGSYFHFICITNNNVNAKRAMAVDPQILA